MHAEASSISSADIAPERTPIDPLSALLPALRSIDIPIIWLNWGDRPDVKNMPPWRSMLWNSARS